MFYILNSTIHWYNSFNGTIQWFYTLTLAKKSFIPITRITQVFLSASMSRVRVWAEVTQKWPCCQIHCLYALSIYMHILCFSKPESTSAVGLVWVICGFVKKGMTLNHKVVKITNQCPPLHIYKARGKRIGTLLCPGALYWRYCFRSVFQS